MQYLIAFVGFKGSGKNTAALPLIEHGFQAFSFADAVKDALAAIFFWPRDLLEGITPESRAFRETVDPWWAAKLNNPEFSPRWAMMHFATDLMRMQFHPQIWVFNIERRLSLLDAQARVVMTDCRFANELAMVRRYGGEVHQIARRSAISATDHPSETDWIGCPVDSVIENDKTVADLHGAVSDRFLTRVSPTTATRNQRSCPGQTAHSWRSIGAE
jgi:hypothetical protein